MGLMVESRTQERGHGMTETESPSYYHGIGGNEESSTREDGTILNRSLTLLLNV